MLGAWYTVGHELMMDFAGPFGDLPSGAPDRRACSGSDERACRGCWAPRDDCIAGASWPAAISSRLDCKADASGDMTSSQVIGTRVIHNCMTTTPIAGREYLARLRLLLLSYGRYRPPPSHRPSSTTVAGASTTSARSSTSLEPSASEAAGMIDPASDMWTGGWVRVPHRVLSRAVLEDVRVRACRVARRGEVVPWNGQEVTPAMAQADEPETGGAGERNAEQDATLARDLYAAYGGTDVLPSVVFSVPDRPGASAGERGTLEVPDWVRLAVGEVFFEKGDEDQASIAEAILGSLAKVREQDGITRVHADDAARRIDLDRRSRRDGTLNLRHWRGRHALRLNSPTTRRAHRRACRAWASLCDSPGWTGHAADSPAATPHTSAPGQGAARRSVVQATRPACRNCDSQ